MQPAPLRVQKLQNLLSRAVRLGYTVTYLTMNRPKRRRRNFNRSTQKASVQLPSVEGPAADQHEAPTLPRLAYPSQLYSRSLKMQIYRVH